MKRAGLFAGLAALIALAVTGYLWWSDRSSQVSETTSTSVQTADTAAESVSPPAESAADPKPETLAQSEPEKPVVGAQTDTASTDSEQTARLPAPGASEPSVKTREVAPPTDSGPAAILPSFDVVRVEPSGEAVIAGRATPRSVVHLKDFGTDIAEVTTNANGEWVIVLRTPLAPGSHELSLESHLLSGEILLSENVVIVSVPAPAVVAATPAPSETQVASPVTKPTDEPMVAAPQPAASAGSMVAAVEATDSAAARIASSGPARPLAVLMPRTGSGASRVIQAPEPVPRGQGREVLLLETVDYDGQGRAVIGGRGKVGVTLLLYLDGQPAGRTVVGVDGRWQVRLAGEVAFGVHTLRVDQLDPSGRVVGRVESPFSRAEILAEMANETAVIVQPGNSLWRISRRIYGKGIQYSVIFEANQDQIGDPDLIYPGQIFVLPKAN